MQASTLGRKSKRAGSARARLGFATAEASQFWIRLEAA